MSDDYFPEAESEAKAFSVIDWLKKRTAAFYAGVGVVAILLLTGLFFGAQFVAKSMYTKVAEIDPVMKTTVTVNLKTEDGLQPVETTLVDLRTSELRARNSMLEQLHILSGHILFLEGNELGVYEKGTKKLSLLSLPPLSEQEGELRWETLTAAELSDTFLYVGVSDNTYRYTAYLLDTQTLELLPAEEFGHSCGLYCIGPQPVISLPNNETLFLTSQGDACWRSDQLHRYRLDTREFSQLKDFTSGCSAEHDSLEGVWDDKLLVGEHEWNGAANFDGTDRNSYLSLYFLDGELNKTVLLSRDEMPDSVHRIYPDESDGVIYLDTPGEEEKYTRYVYTVATDTLELQGPLALDVVTPGNEGVDHEELLANNEEFLKVDITEEPVRDPVRVMTNQWELQVEDREGETIPLLPTSFIDEELYQQEMRCYSSQFLQGRTVDATHIRFRAQLCSIDNEPEDFMLNLKTGEIYRIGKVRLPTLPFGK